MKAKLWFGCVVLLGLFLAGCGGNEEGGEELEQKELSSDWNGTFAQRESIFFESLEGNSKGLYFRESKEPFSGKITSHGSDGELHVFRYRNGLKHGLCIIVDKAGARTETNYHDGVEHGLHVMFGRDGVERFRWRYENGKMIKK
ncbi:MAG: hypothetical protein VB980_05265 [Opitutales bacterium]